VKVRWTPAAEQDRRDVWDYIVTDNPRAAARMDELFGIAAGRLADFPHLARIRENSRHPRADPT
jgi:plasmid stabilization system protein ParE